MLAAVSGGIAMIAIFVGYVFVASEGNPWGRTGLDRDEQGRLVVWLVLCPGEDVRSVQVRNDEGLNWEVEGQGSTQERWVVGDTLPDGYRLIDASEDLRGTHGWVYAYVLTSTADWAPAADQEQLDAPGITFETGQVPFGEFHDKALSSYRCDAPDPEHVKTVALLITFPLFVAFGALSLVSLLWRR